MPRGLSQERAQRIWDSTYGAVYAYLRNFRGGDPAVVAESAAKGATEAVEALREALQFDEEEERLRALMSGEKEATEAVEALRERQRREGKKR